MSNKTISIDTSADDTQNVEDIKQVERQNISKDDHSIHKNDTLVSEDADNKSDNNTIQNASDDTLHTDGAEKIHKKYISESKTDIANLKSEFTGVIVQDIKGKNDTKERLTKNKKIDMIGNSSKYRNSKRKRPNVYSEGTVVVQFLGSENLPAKKVEMIYEPETRNYTVKMMFAMLLMMHFIMGGGTLYLYTLQNIQIWWYWYAPYVALLGFMVTVILITSMICLDDARVGFRSSVVIFGTLISSIAFTSAISYIFQWRLFVFVNASLFFTDIVCIILGCTKFDYTSMLMYAIVVGGGALLGIGVFPGMYFSLHYTIFGQTDNWIWASDQIIELILAALYLLISLAALVAELHIMLDGETIQMAEDDYMFGAYLLFISVIDFPIRFMRKRGYLGEKGEREEKGGDEEGGGWSCNLM